MLSAWFIYSAKHLLKLSINSVCWLHSKTMKLNKFKTYMYSAGYIGISPLSFPPDDLFLLDTFKICTIFYSSTVKLGKLLEIASKFETSLLTPPCWKNNHPYRARLQFKVTACSFVHNNFIFWFDSSTKYRC